MSRKSSPPLRAAVVELSPLSVHVKYPDSDDLHEVPIDDIEQRLLLPWSPRDLRDDLIVYRRRDVRKDEYVEDFRVRRNLIKCLLRLFFLLGTWRENQGIETLHKYYTSCDWMEDHEIDELLPEDDIPNDLHFETIPEDNEVATVSFALFRDWLQEGKFNCDVAQMLLAFWIDDRAQSKHYEILDDFFSSLVTQMKAEVDVLQTSNEQDDTLTVEWLGEFILKHCNVPYSVPEASLESLLPELIQRNKDEIVAVQSYVNTCRGTATVQKAESENIFKEHEVTREECYAPLAHHTTRSYAVG